MSRPVERNAVRVLKYCVAHGVPRRSLRVALVVGTILNLINQGDVLLSGEQLQFGKLFLTYLVPYCVATYGAVAYRLHAEASTGAQR